jgi:hypothetical protein
MQASGSNDNLCMAEPIQLHALIIAVRRRAAGCAERDV